MIDLHGKKTYIAAIALFLYAVGGGISGKIPWDVAIAEIIAAFGLFGLRNAL